jgi:uncharacterized membrane protein required for colicin V production
MKYELFPLFLYCLVIFFVVFLMNSYFNFKEEEIFAENVKVEVVEVKESKTHLTNPNKALELVIKHLREEHNIIVPIEDVDRLEIKQ